MKNKRIIGQYQQDFVTVAVWVGHKYIFGVFDSSNLSGKPENYLGHLKHWTFSQKNFFCLPAVKFVSIGD